MTQFWPSEVLCGTKMGVLPASEWSAKTRTFSIRKLPELVTERSARQVRGATGLPWILLRPKTKSERARALRSTELFSERFWPSLNRKVLIIVLISPSLTVAITYGP